MTCIAGAEPTEIPPALIRSACIFIRIHIHYLTCHYPTITYVTINWKLYVLTESHRGVHGFYCNQTISEAGRLAMI